MQPSRNRDRPEQRKPSRGGGKRRPGQEGIGRGCAGPASTGARSYSTVMSLWALSFIPSVAATLIAAQIAR